jgi:protein tyrosine/serine phosphatase
VNVPRFIRRLFRTPYDGLQHLGVVSAGALYRCGQPTPAQLAELVERYSLRTVVSLRGQRDEGDPDAWEHAERGVCVAKGALFLPIPCNHKNPPTPAQVQEFLGLFHTADRQPVLVHCRLGQQRTLLFCALYRVHVQGVAPAEAEREMDALGFGVHHRRHRRLLDAFRTLARRDSSLR